jgi:hypothetical protein
VFAAGEPLIVYTEPIGVTWKQADGPYSSKLMVDFEIKTPDGKTITGQKDFGQFTLAAREPYSTTDADEVQSERRTARRLHPRPHRSRRQDRDRTVALRDQIADAAARERASV